MNMYKNSLLMAVAFVTGLLGAQVASLVTAHGGDGARIHACVNQNSGEVKIVAADASCKKGFSPLDWNIQGPAGPPGSGGLFGYEIVTTTCTIPNDGASHLCTATCSPGKRVLGGGYEGEAATITIDAPALGQDGWTIEAGALQANDQTIEVSAICANVP